MRRINNTKQYGQALLFVVVAVTIALSVGVSIATRTLSSQKRVTRSDTATRVTSAAEGGAEAMLGKSYTFLASFSGGHPDCVAGGMALDSTGTKCVITYPSAPGDKIVTKATVTAVSFTLNESDHYWFDLSPGVVKEIRLVNYTGSGPYVCWENSKAAIYTLSYNPSGDIKKGWFVSSSFDNGSNASGFSTVSNTHPEHPDYTGCAQAPMVSTPYYGLRIRALYSPTRVHVYPVGGTFPIQGYKITSVGELVSGGSEEARIVVVYKSFPYAASILDYGLYSATGDMN